MQISFRHEYQELVASDTCDPVRPACLSAKEICRRANELIAGLVTVAIIHRLEVVEVGAHDGDRARVPHASRLLGADVFIPGGAILETGQRVDPRLAREPIAVGGETLAGDGL